MDFIYDFDWRTAPLRDIRYPVTAIALYAVCVALLDRRFSGTKAPAFLSSVQAVHNLVLAAWSLLMLVAGLILTVQRIAAEGSASWFVCEHSSTTPTGPLFFVSFIYYLSKYYELLDTLIQLAKGTRPPSFWMHVYHHSVVMFMAWMWLEYAQSLQFGGIIFNTLVHVVMYYYFFLRAIGVKNIWWKNYITKLQIIQFVTSLLFFAAFLYTKFVVGDVDLVCAGEAPLYFNCVFNASLLLLFMGVLKHNTKNSNKSS